MSAIKPRIKTLMDAYITVNHKLSEVNFEELKNSFEDIYFSRMNSLNSKLMIHLYKILLFKSIHYLFHLK
jgi:hypothetical protein